MITIRKVSAILTAPDGVNLIVVKVQTSEPELYGLGCATFAYRELAVKCVVEEYLDPLLQGRNVADIEEIWQLMHQNAYWRNGPIANNAISGVDMALWDIKGKMANMPVCDLWGGKARQGIAVYRHAEGDTLEKVAENVQKYRDENISHVRVQWGGYGGKSKEVHKPDNALKGIYYRQDQYMDDTLKLMDYMRGQFGYDLKLLHDCHERLAPIDAVRLAKDLEKYRLFFLEDLLSPEQGPWFEMIRSQCATPIAMGELLNNPKEWDYLITNRLIDFIRVHVSQIGGVTAARKLAIFCEQFGVRTAWHGPRDLSPIGHAANIHLDLTARNFGIQEWNGIVPAHYEVFPGAPEVKDGYVYINDKPGWGVDIDEEKAAKYPCTTKVTEWTQTRITDGSLHTP